MNKLENELKVANDEFYAICESEGKMSEAKFKRLFNFSSNRRDEIIKKLINL